MTRVSYLAALLLLGCCAETVPLSAATNALSSAPQPDAGVSDRERPVGVALCYTPESTNSSAVKRFNAVFHSADYAARDSMIAELESAATANPNQEHYQLLIGASYLWRLREPHDLVHELLVPESAILAEEAFARAYELCPTDHRIAGWLGPIKIILGNIIGDTQRVADGEAMLKRGSEIYPNFVLFSYVIAYGELQPGDPRFEAAIKEFEKAFVLPIEASPCAKAQHDLTCINSASAVHNVEASSVYAGDFYARAQDRETALAWYNLAKGGAPAWASPAWDTWRYQYVIEERIQSLDQRMAAALTPSTEDDFESVWSSPELCTICHAQ